ncbi:MAG: hypothetical protein LM557_04535 [Desulfurococcaceae archaeon]|jgi:hypothetical protein|nr:hypothetical protein [Desulfurococcaceae archaeon]
MSSITATRSLLSNAWYFSKIGFKRGFVFLYGSRVMDEGEEPLPEYELSELIIDFEGKALILHGYSLLLDIVEYVFRGMKNRVDLSVLSKEEIKELAEVGLVNAYMSGVTLPLAVTEHVSVLADAARENGVRAGVIAERGTVTTNPFLLVFEVDNERLYYQDKVIGGVDEVLCTPQRVKNTCLIVDARGYGNTLTAIEEVYRSSHSVKEAYEILTGPYRASGVDEGYVVKGAASDLIVYDLRNPLKAGLQSKKDYLYSIIARSQQPDIVFVGGDVFYEFGENLAIPISRVDRVVAKLDEELK